MSKSIRIGQYRLVETNGERSVMLIIGRDEDLAIWKAKKVSSSGMERVDLSDRTPSKEISSKAAYLIALDFAAKKVAGFLEIHH